MVSRQPEIKETLAEVGAFFGVTERTIDNWQKAGCPCKGGPYDLYPIVEWWAREKQAGNKEKMLDAELKRRRLEQQIKSEELDYAERVDELMPRAHASVVFDTVAAEYRKAGELLLRQFGDDAQLVVLEALDSVDDILSKKFNDKKGGK